MSKTSAWPATHLHAARRGTSTQVRQRDGHKCWLPLRLVAELLNVARAAFQPRDAPCKRRAVNDERLLFHLPRCTMGSVTQYLQYS